MRNTCAAFAFDAAMDIRQAAPHQLTIRWEKDGAAATLTADVKTCAFSVQADLPDGKTFAFTQP